VDELKRQKDALEKALGHEIVSVRQHYLHYDIRITPAVHATAGFKYDSTLGFNDNIGFRFGTSYPWHLYDLKAEKELPIMEIPLIVQDGAMLNPDKGMRLDEETAFQYIKQIAKAVEKVGGVLTLLWHPNSIIKEDWWNLSLKTLGYLKKKDAWFGAVREIGKCGDGV
jgi:peptidoglycan/xylan/chitin deacetylase (PgdA/CDA1 family)